MNKEILYVNACVRKESRTKRPAEKLISKRDALVVVFNWPSHGDDVKKKLVLEDCNTYLDLVIREVKTRYQVDRLFAYATSFGGYLVLKYISEHANPFEKIALRCPAVDMYHVLVSSITFNPYTRIFKDALKLQCVVIMLYPYWYNACLIR